MDERHSDAAVFTLGKAILRVDFLRIFTLDPS